MSLEQTLQREVQMLCCDDDSTPTEETLRSIRLTVLTRAARILRVPFDPTDFSNNRIVISLETLKSLDKAWSRIMCTFTDNRISNQEKYLRERLFFNAPYYTDRTHLIRFINVLVKRDAATYSVFTTRRRRRRRSCLLKTTVLNQVLAIDGFRGILPWQCRNYTNHLNDRLPVIDKTHLEATRSLYASGGDGDLFVNFSGTVAAALVLLALLKLYMDKVGPRMDRATRHVAEKAVECVSNFVDDHSRSSSSSSSSNNNSKKTNKRIRRTVAKISRRYLKIINDDSMLEGIAFRKLIDYGKNALQKYLP